MNKKTFLLVIFFSFLVSQPEDCSNGRYLDEIFDITINSNKIKKVLGFEPKRSIEMAIKDLCDAFKEGKIINSFENDLYFNLNRLKNIKAK